LRQVKDFGPKLTFVGRLTLATEHPHRLSQVQKTSVESAKQAWSALAESFNSIALSGAFSTLPLY
jgi:hypothetical protein